METNFLSRYENKITGWNVKIKDDPANKKKYESEMSEYIAKCIPYMIRYTSEGIVETVDDQFGIKVKKGTQRKDIYGEYLLDVEEYKGTEYLDMTRGNEQTGQCLECQSFDLIYDKQTSTDICRNCGISCEVINSDNISYKEEHETERKITYSYKRDNHFNEWLLQFQARETTNIPDEVIDQLRYEFKKQKILNIKEINHKKVRTLLKKLRLNKYYEHIPYITNMLNGLKPPCMSQELEEKLRHMFVQIQKPFDDHCPETRKNFLSYSYVLYKFCELLGHDEFLPCFPLLKSKEKLYQQDVLWKKICDTLQWEYIPSI